MVILWWIGSLQKSLILLNVNSSLKVFDGSSSAPKCLLSFSPLILPAPGWLSDSTHQYSSACIAMASAIPPIIKLALGWGMRLTATRVKEQIKGIGEKWRPWVWEKKKIIFWIYCRLPLYRRRKGSPCGVPRPPKVSCVDREGSDARRSNGELVHLAWSKF